MRCLSFLLFLLVCGLPAQAQDQADLSPIVFIYDASGSMWGQLQGKTKMEIASSVLSESVNGLSDNQGIGLVAYGHRREGDCQDVEFLVDMANGSKPKVNTALAGIKPLGRTPLAYSATQVIDSLRASDSSATVILITDGIESCGGNICDVVQAAKSDGIDFRLHIVGFGLKESETEQLRCAADAGDGNYYDAANASALGEVLTEATAATVDEPKGNVSVYAFKNGIAIDAYVKAYDTVAKREPISVRTYQDTAYFYLPPSTYRLEVTPLEGSDVKMVAVEGVQSFEDEIVHQDISFDGGKIGFTVTNNEENWDSVVKVIDQSGKLAASVRTYQTPKEVEVNPGTYKVTIQALAMKGLVTSTEIEDVVVEAGGLIPISYGFDTGKAFVDARVAGNSIDSIVTITEANTGKSVDAGRTYNRGKEFLLTTGTYKVKVAPLGDYKDREAQTVEIAVTKGETTTTTLTF